MGSLQVLAHRPNFLGQPGRGILPLKRITKGARTPRDVCISLRVRFRGRKLRPGYPEDPGTIGDQLRKVRLDRGLRQNAAAREIGCSKASLTNWEEGVVG